MPVYACVPVSYRVCVSVCTCPLGCVLVRLCPFVCVSVFLGVVVMSVCRVMCVCV